MMDDEMLLPVLDADEPSETTGVDDLLDQFDTDLAAAGMLDA